MKYFYFAFALVIVLIALIAGPRGLHSPNRPIEIFPDMVRQAKAKPQTPSNFFGDGLSNRDPVPGTVTMGFSVLKSASNAPSQDAYTNAPDYFNTGKMGDHWGTGIPITVTPELLARGQERFNINCAVCHGMTGAGNGITTKYGLVGVANYHQDKYLKMSDGQIFNTITNGYNSMLGYGANITTHDRWAIVCYLRALQRSQRGTLNDLTPEQQTALTSAATTK